MQQSQQTSRLRVDLMAVLENPQTTHSQLVHLHQTWTQLKLHEMAQGRRQAQCILDKIPSELICYCFQFLAIHEILRACSRVCMTFAACAKQPQSFQVLSLTNKLIESKVRLVSMHHRFTHLRVLNLAGVDAVDDETLEHLLLPNCGFLRVLNLSYCSRITDRTLANLGNSRSISRLQRLCLFNNPNITSRGLSFLSCPRLLELDLSCCDEVSDVGLTSMAPALGNLQSLNLSECQSLTSDGITVAVQSLSSLEVLNLSLCSVSAELMQELAYHTTHLLSLKLASCNLRDESLHALSLLSGSLTSLDLTGCRTISDSGLGSVALLQKLKALYLGWVSNLSDCGLEHIGSLGDLRTLVLARCCKVTDNGMLYIARGCHLLEELDIAHCYLISNQTLHELAAGCKHLKKLHIQGCDQFTNLGRRVFLSSIYK